MTPKERMLTAINNQQPDRVPVAPDISNMIPARLTGKPFWDIYLYNDPPLWQAYIDAFRYFGFDGWVQYCESVEFKYRDDQRRFTTSIIKRTSERIITQTVCHTPAGDLTSETVYYIADPPTVTKKWIKNLQEDLPKLQYFYPQISGCDASILRRQEQIVGQEGIVGCVVFVPGFHNLMEYLDGGITAITYAYYDQFDLLSELIAIQEANYIKQAEIVLDLKPDFIIIGASGLWTLNNPSIFRQFSLPALKKITHMAKEAGVPSILHSCGKERDLATICANETELTCINPLEEPPQGDCDLGEVKRSLGIRLSLFGNLHTTRVMLLGSTDDVEKASRKCIDDAAEGGGFILSTGDQCGRDTPDANIFKMVEVAKTYGQYK